MVRNISTEWPKTTSSRRNLTVVKVM